MPSECPGCGREHDWDSDFCAGCKGLTWGHVPGGTRPFSGPATKEPPSWERGIVTERRGDVQVPLRDASLKPIRVKQYANNRAKFDALRRKLHNTPEGE